jgi:trypsin-like peptidase
MLVKQPIIRGGVDRASRAAICITLFCVGSSGEEQPIGSGTGFVHRHLDRDYLVTNWHVVTGRNPNDPGRLLPGYPASPTALQLHLPASKAPNHFLPSALFPLYLDGRPQWIQTRFDHTSSRVDLIAVPFEFGDEPLIVRIEEFSPPHDQVLRIGRDVVIVGYPFGIRAENPYPTWKRGAIASEPSILLEALLKYHIDTPGRPGMSGSPVFMITSGKGVSKQTHDLIDQAGKGISALEATRNIDVEELLAAPDVNLLRFAGVYSGSVGDNQLLQMNLGVAWHAAVVDRLFTAPIEGENPFPPLT